jgi:hypothetical protein
MTKTDSVTGLPQWALDLGLTEPVGLKLDSAQSEQTFVTGEEGYDSFDFYYYGAYAIVEKEAKKLAEAVGAKKIEGNSAFASGPETVRYGNASTERYGVNKEYSVEISGYDGQEAYLVISVKNEKQRAESMDVYYITPDQQDENERDFVRKSDLSAIEITLDSYRDENKNFPGTAGVSYCLTKDEDISGSLKIYFGGPISAPPGNADESPFLTKLRNRNCEGSYMYLRLKKSFALISGVELPSNANFNASLLPRIDANTTASALDQLIQVDPYKSANFTEPLYILTGEAE